MIAAVGCKPVLPTVEPGEDPSEASAEASPWTPSPSPYETSAFEGVKLGGGGHAHHGHHGHGKKAAEPRDAGPKGAEASEPEAAPKDEAHQHGGAP